MDWIMVVLIFVLNYFISEYILGLFRLRFSTRVHKAAAHFVVYFLILFLVFHIFGYISMLYPVLSLSNVFILYCVLFFLIFVFKGFGFVRIKNYNRVKVPLVVVIVVGFLLVLTIVNGLSVPPRGWDSLTHRLPSSLGWIQNNDLCVHGQDPLLWTTGNAEIMFYLLLQTGFESLVNIMQIGFALLIMLGVFVICYELGVSEKISWYMGAGAFSMPVVLFQSSLAYTDVMFFSFLVVSVMYLVMWSKESVKENDKENVKESLKESINDRKDDPRLGFKYLIFSGLASGLMIGVKSFALYFIPLLVFWILMFGDGGIFGRIKDAAVFLVMHVFSLFFFIRNLILTGNPLWPYDFVLGGVRIFKGFFPLADNPLKQFDFVSRTAGWWIHPWTEFYNHEAGLGILFAGFVVVVLMYFIVYVAKRISGRQCPSIDNKSMLVMFIILSLAIWYFATMRDPRHILIAPILGFVLVGCFLQRATMKNVFMALFILGLVLNSVFVTVHAFENHNFETGIKFEDRQEFYRLPDVIDGLPSGSVVLNYYEKYYNYQLYGSKLQNKVVLWTERDLDEIDLSEVDYVFYRGSERLDLDEFDFGRKTLNSGVKLNLEYYEEFKSHQWWDSEGVIMVYKVN